ncbi:hypothetical protein F0562_012040 [Nyssa sinensis]|uniref:Uncharacterized protein n=1 Tax=Nyssa sinensis TaxID=561372 RepID=A0A5J4ZUN9_9ASTE|nr:hypothetical protein F0562_012040 [Nyssa sinensis]
MGLGLATAEETIVDGMTLEVIDRTVVEIIGREDRDFVRSRGWDLCGRMDQINGFHGGRQQRFCSRERAAAAVF